MCVNCFIAIAVSRQKLNCFEGAPIAFHCAEFDHSADHQMYRLHVFWFRLARIDKSAIYLEWRWRLS